MPCFSQTDSETAIRLIAQESEAAPDQIGGTITKILASAVNDAGKIAFSATLSGSSADSAIFLSSGGTTRVLLRSGDEAPGGGRFKAFSDLDLALLEPENGGEEILLFRAEISDGAASEGVFIWQSDGVEAFALAGELSPRGNVYKSFSNLTIASVHPTAPQYKAAFIAATEDGNKSVILKASYQTYAYENLRIGDVLSRPKPNGAVNEVIDDFTISRLGYSLSCVALVHREGNKKVRYRKVITLDGFIAFGDALKEGVKYPTLGKVKRIFDSPAMNFQQGYAAIEFKNGVSALATRDIDGGSEIIIRSGTESIDSSGDVIQSFGPPITCPFQVRYFDEFGQEYKPFGIVSPVRLSSGREALWLGVFSHKVPALSGHTSLLMIGGSATIDGQEVVLRSMVPVKLTNTGTLLVRATTGEGDLAREGLYVMEGLFDE